MDRDTVEPDVAEMPGERARGWVEYHDDYAATSTAAYDFVWDVNREATGPFCTDVDGNVLLDFTSHVAAAPLGYNNPDVAEKMEALDLPSPTKIAGQSFYTASGWPPEDPELPGPIQLMERLTEISRGYGLDTVFLSNTGAEAVENSMKICYDHRGGASQGITFRGAFHGRTLGALSLNRSKAVHRREFPEVSGVHELPFCRDTSCTPETCSCGFFPDEGTSLLQDTLDPKQGYVDPDDLAYLVVEPVQGEGGYRFPSEAFADEIQRVCSEHDVLLVADEIQTGLGRTGEWWASDHYGFEPDVIASAKALQVGATLSRREVFPEEEARISSTWGGGDYLSALQGATIIDVIREQGLLEQAVDRGGQFKNELGEAELDAVSDVRGEGLMLALTLPSKQVREDVVEAAFTRGLLTMGCGRRSIRVLPPLDVTEREISLGVSLLVDAVDDVTR